MSPRTKRFRDSYRKYSMETCSWWEPDRNGNAFDHFPLQYALSDQGRTWTDGVQRPVLRMWELLWAGIAQLSDLNDNFNYTVYALARSLGVPPGVLERHPYLISPSGAWLYHVCRNDWVALEKEIADNNMVIFDGVLADQLMDDFNPVVDKGAGSPRKSRQAGPAGPEPLIVPRMAPYPTEGHAGGVIPAPDPLPIRWHVMKVKETDPIRLCAAQSPWD